MEKQYRYKLAISIMTRGRNLFVEELLTKLSKSLYEKNIGLYLFDGNDDNSLAGIVEKYTAKGYDNIHYSYYDPEIYVDDRGIDWQRNYDYRTTPDAEYVWICSDKLVPRKECLDGVLQQLDKGYNVIVYNAFPPYPWGPSSTKEYFDKAEFFRECGPRLQMLLVPILHRSIIDQFIMEKFKKYVEQEKYTDVEWILQAIAEIENFSALLFCWGGKPYKPNQMMLPFPTDKLEADGRSNHVILKMTFWLFIDKVYNTVSGLPSIYNSEKKTVMKNFSCYTWFSLEGFMLLRAQGGYDFKLCLSYLNKFKYVTNVPVPIILGIALLPPQVARFLCRGIRKYKEIRRMPHF